MDRSPRFPLTCAAPHEHADEREGEPAPASGLVSSPGEGRAVCELAAGPSARLPTCSFWSPSTAGSQWWGSAQLSLPGVEATGVELLELREVGPRLVDLLAEIRTMHGSGYLPRTSALVDLERVHETDDRLNTVRNFGHHVRSLRRARGMTQEALADRCGLSADTIRRLEHGSFSPSLDTLRKLCVGLDLMMSTLFESFELGARNEARELLDLLSTRTPRELALATRVLRVLFDELDDMSGVVVRPPLDEDDEGLVREGEVDEEELDASFVDEREDDDEPESAPDD